MSERIIERHLKSIYYDPKNEASFGSFANLLKKARERFPLISEKFVKNWLISQKTYTIHKPVRRRFKRNPIIVKYPNEQWQADLTDVSDIYKENNGTKYLLTIIDCFSKFAYVLPLKNKTGPSVEKAFKSVLVKTSPKKIQTDMGKEFLNSSVKELFEKYKINHFIAQNSDIKCSMVERFNKTIKNKIYKYLTSKRSKKYIDQLQNIVDSYNNKIHRSTKFKPNQVTIDNQKQVFNNLYNGKSYRELLKIKNKSKIDEGDKIRISRHNNKFTRSYKPGWSEEVFTVTKKYDKKIPLFKIRDENEEIGGRFYPLEIQKIKYNYGPNFRIEKIIKTRKVGKTNEYFVKFLNEPEYKNAWITGKELSDLQ